MNVPLFHMLNIRNGDICGMQHKIVTKCLYEIITVSAEELSSTNKH